MVNDVNKYFDNNNYYYTNKQLIGHINLFRVVIVKEWAIGNHNKINCHVHNKVLVKICIHFYHECWKRRCVVLHNLEYQHNELK